MEKNTNCEWTQDSQGLWHYGPVYRAPEPTEPADLIDATNGVDERNDQ